MKAPVPLTFARRLGTLRWQIIGIFVAAILVAAVPSLVLSWRAIDDTRSEIEDSRLRLAQLAATQADRILAEAFFEIELASTLLPIDEDDASLSSDGQPLRTLYGSAASFSAGILFLDTEGRVVLAEPEVAAMGLDGGQAAELLAAVVGEQDREVSEPFVSSATGHAVTALSVSVYDEGGQRMGTVIGLLDLAEPLITDLVEPAREFGATGHADLVDERGVVLASTEHGHVMTPGDHPNFYRRMAETRIATVERVAHEHDIVDGEESMWHVMAYAPLRNAPWAIALGASEGETMRTVSQLRRTLITLGTASLATLLVGAILATLRVPVRLE